MTSAAVPDHRTVPPRGWWGLLRRPMGRSAEWAWDVLERDGWFERYKTTGGYFTRWCERHGVYAPGWLELGVPMRPVERMRDRLLAVTDSPELHKLDRVLSAHGGTHR